MALTFQHNTLLVYSEVMSIGLEHIGIHLLGGRGSEVKSLNCFAYSTYLVLAYFMVHVILIYI